MSEVRSLYSKKTADGSDKGRTLTPEEANQMLKEIKRGGVSSKEMEDLEALIFELGGTLVFLQSNLYSKIQRAKKAAADSKKDPMNSEKLQISEPSLIGVRKVLEAVVAVEAEIKIMESIKSEALKEYRPSEAI